MHETCTPSVILSFVIFALTAAIFHEPEAQSDAEAAAIPEVAATEPKPALKPVETPIRAVTETKPSSSPAPVAVATGAPAPTPLVTPVVPEAIAAPILPVVPSPAVSAPPPVAKPVTIAAADPVVPRSQSPQVSQTPKAPTTPALSPAPAISPVRTSRVSLAGRASNRPGLLRDQSTAPRAEFTTVRRGETLSDVAIRVYGASEFTKSLWRANREQLERIDTPLSPGNLLRTPSLD